jgi:LacI family transcriptional regulator
LAPKRASIADLAQALNLSGSTVSRALSGHPGISEATKQKVWALAEQLHYQPNHLAAALRKGRSNLIGVMVPHIEGHFFASVVHGIERVARSAGYNVMICQSNEDVNSEKQNIEAMMSAQVEGILASLARTTRDFRHFEKIRRREIPLVLFDRTLEHVDVSSVVIDDYLGAFQLVQHLVDQGARRIAHFAGPRHLNIYNNRYRGYYDALLRNGLTPDEALIHHCDLTYEDGVAGMEKLLQLPEPPDAVFSASDMGALGAMHVLKARGRRVPQDMLLAGFSNEPLTSFTEPMLTSVDQRCEQMGQAAVHLLFDIMRGPAKDFLPRRIVLPPDVLIRASSSLHPVEAEPVRR